MNSATEFIISLLKSNRRRLLKLYFPANNGPSAGLLINRLVATESLSHDFTYTITALSDDPHIDPTEVQGCMVCVELLRETGNSRYFNGHCYEFSLQRVENGLAVYQMVLKPWLALFRLKRDHCLFHQQNITAQTKQIFLETGLARHEFRTHLSDPARTFSCQYDETSYNYLHRRWEEMGWHYWYEHDMNGHRLILSDTSQNADSVDGVPHIAWHHGGGSNKRDKIGHWSPRRKLVSGRVTYASFDFKRPIPQASGQRSDNLQGAIHQIEVYQYRGLYGFKNPEHANHLAELHMQAIDAQSQQYHGKGNSRAMQPGRWFALHRDNIGQLFADPKQDNEFFITEVSHVADNNYLNADGADASYENEFTCVPRNVAWRPEPGYNSHPVKAHGVDSAIVIGFTGQETYTDEYGRVKVQFHWDRIDKDTNRVSTWLRVASQWAGAELGAMALPRVGSEVLVQWLAGNPDRPIITGAVFNPRNMPPWQLPSQQALMGFRSRELTPGSGNAASGRSNHLLLDDTAGKIQAQLKSDHQSSQLSLGHISRIESNAGRKDERGEGWELATNAWGVARAGKGMLLTTEARQDAASHIKDMGEAAARLMAAHDQHDALAKQAQSFGAQLAKKHQSLVAEALQKQNDALSGKGGKGQGSDKFPQLSEPHLVLSSPAGIETTSGRSTHIASEQNTAITSGKNFSVASGDSFFASILNTFRLFVQNAGMKMIAAAGNIDIQALKDSIAILAKLNITQQANRITITAKEEVVINGGGSYVKFSAGKIEMGTSGKHTFHAATHSFVGPKQIPIPEELKVDPDLPIFSQQFDLSHLAYNEDLGLSSESLPYRVFDKAGKFITAGMTNEDGLTDRILTNAATELVVLIGDGGWTVEEHFEHEELSDNDNASDDAGGLA